MLVTLSNYLNDKPFQSKYSFKTPNYHKDIKYLTIASHNKIPVQLQNKFTTAIVQT